MEVQVHLEDLMVKAMGLSLLPMTCSPLLPVKAESVSESDSASERYEPSFAGATSSSLASLVSPSAAVWVADRLGSLLHGRGRERKSVILQGFLGLLLSNLYNMVSVPVK